MGGGYGCTSVVHGDNYSIFNCMFASILFISSKLVSLMYCVKVH